MSMWQELSKLSSPIYSCEAKAWWKGKEYHIKAPGAIVRPKSQNKRGRPRKSQGLDMEGEGSNDRLSTLS